MANALPPGDEGTLNTSQSEEDEQQEVEVQSDHNKSGDASAIAAAAGGGGGGAGAVGMGGAGTPEDRKRLFSKELRCMMYGFGDDQNPYTESVDFIEHLVIEYVTEMTQKAMDVGKTGRVQVEDIMHLVKHDARKYARVKDLLSMNEELKKARKAFDEVKYATGV